MTEATAKPWRRIQGGTTIVGGKGMFVCQTRISNFTADDREAQANAELIVRAVNSHDDLQATISRLTAERDGARAAAIEECAKVLDSAAQDWNRIRDPGMANNARAYAKKLRRLATPAVTDAEQGGA